LVRAWAVFSECIKFIVNTISLALVCLEFTMFTFLFYVSPWILVMLVLFIYWKYEF